MIKTYKKVATIQAEQFDGSDEMINKYNIDIDGTDSCAINTLESCLKFNKGDWIATGVNGEHWAIADDIFKKSYVEMNK